MLREIKHVSQFPREPFRRWFAGSFMDLFVWYDDQRNITGFQLSYRKGEEEKSVTWYRDKGFTHETVDDGEARSGRHKMSPILVPDGVFDREDVLDLFQSKSRPIEPEIVNFVTETLRQCPEDLR